MPNQKPNEGMSSLFQHWSDDGTSLFLAPQNITYGGGDMYADAPEPVTDPSELPALPPTLKELCCIRLGLTALPDDLPEGLEELVCCWHKMTKLPARLPPRLKVLRVIHGHLTELPSCLPAGLIKLDVRYNRLTALPESLPVGLKDLNCMMNRIASLPSSPVPEGLEIIQLYGNPIPNVIGWNGNNGAGYMQSQLRIRKRTSIIKEELMMEVWAPRRVEKRLEAGEELETVLEVE